MSIVDADAVFALLRGGAGETVSDAAADSLLEVALEARGRALLIGLVNRPGLRNAARRAILEALSETLELDDAASLARAVVRQHVSVAWLRTAFRRGWGGRGEPLVGDITTRR